MTLEGMLLVYTATLDAENGWACRQQKKKSVILPSIKWRKELQKKKIKGKGKKEPPSTSANERILSSMTFEELRKDYVRESIDDSNDPPLGNCASIIGDLLGCPGCNRGRWGGKEEKKSGL